MLSRVAERVYWAGRYVERAENTARLVTVNTNLLLDLPRRTTLGWQPLVEITGSKRQFSRLFRNATEKNVVRFLISDTRNPASLLNCLQFARENARTIRDIIPRDGWEAVNALYWQVKAALPSGIAQKNRHEFLTAIIAGTQRTTGLFAGTMFSGRSWLNTAGTRIWLRKAIRKAWRKCMSCSAVSLRVRKRGSRYSALGC